MLYEVITDYPMASSSLNQGIPLTVHAPHAALTQWYAERAAVLAGKNVDGAYDASNRNVQKNSLFSRYWGGLTFS